MQLDPDRLRQLVPLSNLDARGLDQVLRNSSLLGLRHGETLLAIGDTAPYSFYLLDGELGLRARDGVMSTLAARGPDARYPVGNLIPRQVEARVASGTATVLRIDRDLVERELLLIRLAEAAGRDPDTRHRLSPQDLSWIVSLLHTPLFARLPLPALPELIERLDKVRVRKGQVVIRQGAPGDYFYVLRQGSARVVRESDGREVLLNRLGELDAFGDEALVAQRPRGASVVMDSDGVLMRLSGEDFHALMEGPATRSMGWAEAQALIAAGQARLIDVREEDELAGGALPGAQNIPMYLLYLKSRALPHDRRYVLVGSTRGQAQAAALLLTQRGCEAYVLEGAPG